MISCWIAVLFGIVLVALGLIGAMGYWIWEKAFIYGLFCLVFCSMLSMIFLAPPLYGRWRDLTYTYTQPTFIMKTNNVTVLTYIENGEVRLSASYDKAEWWNSTNIAVRKTSGRNFFGYPLEGHSAEFVAR